MCFTDSKSDQLDPNSDLLAPKTSFQAKIIHLSPQMLPLRPLVRYLGPHASSLGNHWSLAPLIFFTPIGVADHATYVTIFNTTFSFEALKNQLSVLSDWRLALSLSISDPKSALGHWR